MPPFSVRGEFIRQNGPSRLAVVSVWPLLPLLSRQTRAEKPSEPDISTTSLCVALVIWPSLAMICTRLLEFVFGQMHVAREGVQVLDQRGDDLAQPRVLDVLVGVQRPRA